MGITCNPGEYIEKANPSLSKLIKEVGCIDPSKAYTILMPSSKESDTMYKDFVKKNAEFNYNKIYVDGKAQDHKNVKGLDELVEAKTRVLDLMLKTAITPEFPGGVVQTYANHSIKVSKVDPKSLEFTISYGKEEVKCVIDKDVVPAPVFGKPNGYRNFSVAIIKSGKYDLTGEEVSKAKGKGEDFYGGSPEGLNMDADVYQIKQEVLHEILENSKQSGFDFFIPHVAGIIKSLESRENSATLCKKFASFFYPCAAATFAVLVQPHNKNGQFLPDDIILDTMLAPCFNVNYDDQREAFISKHGSPQTRVEFGSKIKHVKEGGLLHGKYLEIYERERSLYDSSIEPLDKLWADELAFRIWKKHANDVSNFDEVDSLMKSVSGSNISKESIFQDNKFWETMLSEKYMNDANGFFSGPWLLHVGDEVKYEHKPGMPRYIRSIIKLNA